jgi:hypothetical protein
LTRAHIKVKLRVYALEAHLPKIFGSSYSINMTIYYPPIEPSSAKSRYGKRRTYPLPLDIVYKDLRLLEFYNNEWLYNANYEEMLKAVNSERVSL